MIQHVLLSAIFYFSYTFRTSLPSLSLNRGTATKLRSFLVVWVGLSSFSWVYDSLFMSLIRIIFAPLCPLSLFQSWRSEDAPPLPCCLGRFGSFSWVYDSLFMSLIRIIFAPLCPLSLFQSWRSEDAPPLPCCLGRFGSLFLYMIYHVLLSAIIILFRIIFAPLCPLARARL